MTTTYIPQVVARKHDGYLVTCNKWLCHLHLVVNTMALATDLEAHHSCPDPGGSTHYSWEVTMTLVEQMWAKIDSEYQQLMSLNGYGDGDAIRAAQKGRLRGYAECIQLFMSPHFQTADEVVREVVHRAKMNSDGVPYETPGIGSRSYETARYEPSEAHKETQTKRNSIDEINARGVSASYKEPKQKSRAVITGVDAETRAAIRGLADVAEPDEIAQIYGVTTEVVVEILAKSL